MDPTSVIQPLSFYQLLILLGAIAGMLTGLILLILKKGIQVRRKGTTYNLGKQKKDCGTTEACQKDNIIMLLEAFKIKDDIYAVEKLVYARQRKYLRRGIPPIRELQMSLFQRLRSECEGCDIDEFNLYGDRDYLYFALLTEKVYNGIYASLAESCESDPQYGLQNNVHEYAIKKAEVVFKENSLLLDVSYGGIQSIPRALYEQEFKKIQPQIQQGLVEIIENAVTVAKKGRAKKQQFKQELLSKSSQMHGISEEHLKYLFTDMTADDNFLDNGSE